MSTTILNNIIPIKSDNYLSQDDISAMIIEFLVYNSDDVLVNESVIPASDIINNSLFIYAEKFIINPGIHLRSLGYSNGVYRVKYNFFKKIIGDFSDPDKSLTLKKISPSRTELQVAIPEFPSGSTNITVDDLFNKNMIVSEDMSNSLSGSITYEATDFLNASNSKLSYYTFFGNDQNFLIINKMLFNKDLLLKQYEELPTDITTLTKFTIVEKLVESYEDTVTLKTEIVDDLSGLNFLQGPKINYKTAGLTYRTTPLENFESLATTGSDYIEEITRLYLSSSLIEGIDTNIDYRDYKNFIHFSSAEQRLKNFKDKIKKIEFFDSKLSADVSESSYNSTLATFEYYTAQKNDIINTFDQYEYFMYYESGSYESSSLGVFPDYTWPKYTSTKPYLLYSVTSSEVNDWYSSMIISASEYDNLNPNILTNTIPIEIVLDDQNSQYFTNIQMIGHLLDINYNYVNRMTSIHERQNSIFDGIPRELILPAINHYGFDLRSGNVIKGLVECIPLYVTGS